MMTSRRELSSTYKLRRMSVGAAALVCGFVFSLAATSADEMGRLGTRSAYRPVSGRGEAGYFKDEAPATRRSRDHYRDQFRDNGRDSYHDGNRFDLRDRDDDMFSRGSTRRGDSSSHRSLPWRDRADDLFGTGSRYDRSYESGRYYSEPDLTIPGKVPRSAPRLPTLDDVPRSQHDQLPGIQELISRRYQDPAVLRFIGGLTAERGLAAYAEVLNLIATRHIAPPSPGALAQRGVQNLTEAMRNPVFIQVNRLAGDGRQAAYFQQAMDAHLRQRSLQRAEDAIAVLQSAMQVGQQQLGLSAGVVAMEFISGALESLDRYSAFMPPETAKFMNQQLGASVVGIGVQIEVQDQAITVVKVLPGGSAQQGGLQKGDVIVAVDGRPVQGDLNAATSMITGSEGTPVTLSIIRNGRTPSSVSLVRRSVEIHTVTDVQMIDPAAGVGYLKFETFAASSTKEMEQALWSLHQQGMRSLVIDVTGNPGGLLTTAVEISNLFLTSGTIVSTRGRTQSDNMTETATQPQTWKVPLVVLVDENSASASEIFAAAIQENGRGVIVGRRTYGKGTVQTLFPLQSVSGGVRLTTAKFYSPKGREMAGAGVQPDVPVSAGSDGTRNTANTTDREIATAVDVARQQMTNGNFLSRR